MKHPEKAVYLQQDFRSCCKSDLNNKKKEYCISILTATQKIYTCILPETLKTHKVLHVSFDSQYMGQRKEYICHITLILNVRNPFIYLFLRTESDSI